MNTTIKFALAVAAAVASMAASAQPYGRIDVAAIDSRQARQEERIERGLARGVLTPHEARTLRHGQREIARTESRAKADGRVSRDEARHLTMLLDRADAQIRRLSHGRDGHRPV